MKISNETKVGAITAVAIVVLILGFNYLKGRNLTERSDQIFAIFTSVKGLTVSNPVYINGLQVGKVAKLRETDKNLTGIIVAIQLSKDINIPANSVATINSELLGATSLEILRGDSKTFVGDGDTLRTEENISVVGQISKSINPAIDNVNKTLTSLDELIRKLSTVVDPHTQNNLQSIIANLTASSKSLERLINAEHGVLARSLNNVESITGNFAKNNDKINHMVDNFDRTSQKFADADIDKLINSLAATTSKLEATIGRLNSKDGTAGLLLNDRQLYDEIRQTNRSLTTLLDDLRVNPRRYVNISVFGKKQNHQPLMNPIYDSTDKH
jgi:phospholipid/cholesterol/gamma-HCH transport system substrate-binding protein